MEACPFIIGQKGLPALFPRIMQNKEYFSVVGWREMKVVHGLIPDGHLCAWHPTTCSPTMGLTFDNDFRCRCSKVEMVNLLFSQSNSERKSARQSDVPRREEFKRHSLEISTDMSVTY